MLLSVKLKKYMFRWYCSNFPTESEQYILLSILVIKYNLTITIVIKILWISVVIINHHDQI